MPIESINQNSEMHQVTVQTQFGATKQYRVPSGYTVRQVLDKGNTDYANSIIRFDGEDVSLDYRIERSGRILLSAQVKGN